LHGIAYFAILNSSKSAKKDFLMLKFISSLTVSLLIFSTHASASTTCAQSQASLERTCTTLFDRYVSDLEQCLLRRDTCNTQGSKEDSAKCETVSSCMSSNESSFKTLHHDTFACNYYWNEEHNSCMLRRGLFRPVAHCPGRTTLNASIIGGFDGGIDSDFNCKAHGSMIKTMIRRCKEERDNFQKNCSVHAAAVLQANPLREPAILDHSSKPIWALNNPQGRAIIDRSRNPNEDTFMPPRETERVAPAGRSR
jgi:hypothetical protein